MNHTRPSRWSCRWLRLRASVFGRDDRVTPSSSHLAHCPDCQAYFAAQQHLTTQLRQHAAQQGKVPPAGLETRIIHAVARATPAARRRPVIGLPMGVLAGAAAAVAMALWFAGGGVWPGRAHDQVIADRRAATDRVGNEALPAPSLTALTAPVEQLLQQNPLQDEVDHVYSDARSAVRFLAMNFLPNSSVDPARAPSSAPAIRSFDG
jgi:hypothetical protein